MGGEEDGFVLYRLALPSEGGLDLPTLPVRPGRAGGRASGKAGPGADAGPPAPQRAALIFASETGALLDPENFSRSSPSCCSRARLGRWHPHELRHSGASLRLAQGTPLHVVSEILGHASIAITKDVYGHLVEGDQRAVAESMTGRCSAPVAAPWLPAWLPRP